MVEVKNGWWRSMWGCEHMVEVRTAWLVVVAAQNALVEVENSGGGSKTGGEGQKHMWVVMEGSKHVVEGLWLAFIGHCWPALAFVDRHWVL